MPTIVEALQTATDELHTAAVLLQTLAGQVQQNLDSTTDTTQTIINDFIHRPTPIRIYCDPIDGNDADDGSTPDLAKKSIDGIISGVVNDAIEIRLLNDAVFRRKQNVYVSVAITGVQRSANAEGFSFATRNITLLGTAENSPSPLFGSFCAGLFVFGPEVRLAYINVLVPDMPSGQNTRSFLTNQGSSAIVLVGNPTISVQSNQAGALIGSNGHALVTMTPVLAAGAAGHLFEGVAAGSNPNSLWAYSTNLTSA